MGSHSFMDLLTFPANNFPKTVRASGRPSQSGMKFSSNAAAATVHKSPHATNTALDSAVLRHGEKYGFAYSWQAINCYHSKLLGHACLQKKTGFALSKPASRSDSRSSILSLKTLGTDLEDAFRPPLLALSTFQLSLYFIKLVCLSWGLNAPRNKFGRAIHFPGLFIMCQALELESRKNNIGSTKINTDPDKNHALRSDVAPDLGVRSILTEVKEKKKPDPEPRWPECLGFSKSRSTQLTQIPTMIECLFAGNDRHHKLLQRRHRTCLPTFPCSGRHHTLSWVRNASDTETQNAVYYNIGRKCRELRGFPSKGK